MHCFRIHHHSSRFSRHPHLVHKVLGYTCESDFSYCVLAHDFYNFLILPWHQPYHAVHGGGIYGDDLDCRHGYVETVQDLGMAQYSIQRKEKKLHYHPASHVRIG